MNKLFTGLESDGAVNPWRTRGSFDPSATNNVAASNLPVKSDCVIGPYLDIMPNDCFVLVAPFNFVGIANGDVAGVVGDRLVYVGGDIATKTSWLLSREGYRYAGQRVAVISQLDPAFLM